jgi:hypothetical protein
VLAATTTQTLVDLGAPTLVGAVVGALIAHYTAKSRSREEHRRALDLLVVQDERRAAEAALEGARRVRLQANQGSDQRWGQIHNDWSDLVLTPSRLVRDA